MADKGLVWNLDDIVPAGDVEGLFAASETNIARYAEINAQLSPGMAEADFRRIVEFDEALGRDLARIYDRALLQVETDQKSEDGRLLQSRARDIWKKYADSSRRLSHWIAGKNVGGTGTLDDANAQRLFSAVPDLSYVLQRLRDSERYTLGEREESIIMDKDVNGAMALRDVRDQAVSKLRFRFKPKGARRAKVFKTEDEVQSFVDSPDPDKREAAYSATFAAYGERLDELFTIYQAVCKDWDSMAKLRGHPSPISMQNHSNDIPDAAVDTLLEVCRDNRGVYQDYFRWKAARLGVDKLRRFDIYAPLASTESKIAFPDAMDMVLGGLGEFSAGFGERARSVIDAGHVHSHPAEGKSGGAFCLTVAPDILPYVLLNYTDMADDAMTLAHELGHAIHSIFANGHSYSAQNAPLPLAETASTTAEMVMFEKLLARESDPAARIAMLSRKMGDSYGTVMRQSYFVEFEKRAHEALSKGVTASGLSDIYFETLKEQFGDAVEVDPMFRNEWARIPHIVDTPFYCYAYNFGELLSLALYAQYKREGTDFVPKLERILSYGGAENPQRILSGVGIDMTAPQFWQGSFDIIKGWQKELEASG